MHDQTDWLISESLHFLFVNSLLPVTDKSSKIQSLPHRTMPTHRLIDDGLYIISVDYHRQELWQSWGFLQLILHRQVS